MSAPRARRPALLAACLAAGCATYTPAPLEPLRELEALRARAQTNARPSPAAHIDAALFPLAQVIQTRDGLSRAEANALALLHAPAIASARTDLAIARADALEAGNLHNPQVFVGPRLSTEGAGLVLPLSISWMLPLGGRLSAEEDVASASAEAARWRVLAIELDTLGEVARGYIRVAQLRGELDAARAVVAAQGRIVAWSEALERGGAIDAATAGLARLERYRAEAEVAALEVELDTASLDVLASIGLPPLQELALAASESDLAIAGGAQPSASEGALLAHPRARSAQADFDVAEQEVRLALARQVPDLQIGPEAEGTEDDIEVGIGVGMQIPLFRSGEGEVQAARARQEAARRRYREELASLLGREARARRALERAQALLRAHERRVTEDARRTEQAIDARLRSGAAGVLEVLQALDAVASARRSLLGLRARAAEARLDLALLVGLPHARDPRPTRTTGDKR